MLGIDLSRAFDSITRAALQRSLQHAGAPEPLQQAVLQLHEHCRYRVIGTKVTRAPLLWR